MTSSQAKKLHIHNRPTEEETNCGLNETPLKRKIKTTEKVKLER